MFIKPFLTRIAFTCLLGLSAQLAFSQKVIKTDTGSYKKLRIDPANANGGNVSDVFDEVNYIPLGTTPESLFGSIKQLEVTDDYYIIRDENTNSVLIFNKNGKFHAKIKGKSTEIIDRIRSFTVNRFTKQIICNGHYAKMYYDFDGKLIKKGVDRRTKEGQFWADDYYYIGKNSAVNTTDYNSLESASKYFKPYTRSLLQFVNNDTTVAAMAMQYTELESKLDDITGGKGPLTYFGKESELLFVKSYGNEIYTVTPGSVKLNYKLLLPLTASISKDFTTNAVYRKHEFEYFQKHPSEVFGISNCYQVKNNLLFQLHMWEVNDENNLIYNLQSGTLLAYKHISPDEKNSFLPIYDKISSDFENVGIAACDGTHIYTSMSSIAMFKAKEDTANQHPKYNEVLTKYFATRNRKDNPVIVQLKLKEKL